MPNALPTPSFQNVANYPPALAAQLVALYAQGAATLQFACDFTLADAAVLYTVPAGVRLSVTRPFWEILTSWTGGASSAVGLSSANANFNTKGDLLGGAAGDVAAVMISTGTPFKGTVGAKVATQGIVVLVGGDTIRFDRIVSAFTAGTGIAHVPCRLLPTS